MSERRLAARLCALPIAATIGLLTAGAASAHVTISPTEAAAGSHTVLTVSVPHGCEGSPTTKLAIKMPEQILSVTPTRNPLWSVKKVMTELDEPVADAHGSTVTERVGQVVYTARTPLPDGYRDAFELSLQLPETPGRTLVFPIVQTCAEGETAWVQVPSAGQGEEELEAPAPTVRILPAGTAGAAQHVAERDTAIDDVQPVAANAATDDAGAPALAVAGLVAGLLGLAAGALALVQLRRRS